MENLIVGKEIRHTEQYLNSMDSPDLLEYLGKVIDTCVVGGDYMLVYLDKYNKISIVKGIDCEVTK